MHVFTLGNCFILDCLGNDLHSWAFQTAHASSRLARLMADDGSSWLMMAHLIPLFGQARMLPLATNRVGWPTVLG